MYNKGHDHQFYTISQAKKDSEFTGLRFKNIDRVVKI